MKRRNFFRTVLASGVGMAASPIIKAAPSLTQSSVKPETNIDTAKAAPRTADSMPGRYPGKVVRVNHDKSIINGKPDFEAAYEMLKEGMLKLTGESELNKAWLQFVGSHDVIGLKVNPIGGKLLSTSHAITQAVIKQLEEAGIPKQQLILWDRRQENLEDAAFDEANYPGIQRMATECYDENKSYINADGRFYSEDWIDKEHFLYAEVEEDYDAYTMPYMVNKGKYSYFTKICTQKVTKIINIPILKNAGASVTACMKNLAFGSITNTGRLHKDLWHETCAYACAFPPLRDKVVLNILDGIIGCFDGGPAANPQFICQYKTLLLGSDPVAVDRVAYEVVMKKRIEEGVQREEKAAGRKFMEIAQELNLGICDLDKIELKEFSL